MVPALQDLSVFLLLPKRRWVPSWKHRQAQGSKFKDKRMSFVSHVPQRASNKKRFKSLIRLFNLLSSFFFPLPHNIPSDRPHSQKPLGSPPPPSKNIPSFTHTKSAFTSSPPVYFYFVYSSLFYHFRQTLFPSLSPGEVKACDILLCSCTTSLGTVLNSIDGAGSERKRG